MQDRLVSLLERFELRARVFQAGLLCQSAAYDSGDGLGYLHVLRSGRLQVAGDGHGSRVLEGPALLFYMNPTPHRLRPLGSTTDLVCASFEFGTNVFNPLMRALPGPVAMNIDQQPGLLDITGLLFSEAAGEHCGRQAILDRLSEVLVIRFLRALMDQGAIQVGLLAGLADPRLVHAINALHADPARAWTLDELAALASQSRARFAVRFRETVGTTPMAYLTQWRLSIACSLLRRGASLQVVADEVGYSNAGALSRAFQAQTGMSPGQWRRRHQGLGGG